MLPNDILAKAAPQAALCGGGLPGLRFPGTAGPFPDSGDGSLRLKGTPQIKFVYREIGDRFCLSVGGEQAAYFLAVVLKRHHAGGSIFKRQLM